MEQGQEQARRRGRRCVVVRCTRDEAEELIRLWTQYLFAIESCTHYDGDTLSLNCSEAGSGADGLWFSTRSLVIGYFRGADRIVPRLII